MNFDVIIVKIPKPQIKKVLAHHLAADPSVSLQKALSLLDNLPVVYMRDLSAKELETTLKQLAKMEVQCQVVESKNPLDGIKKSKDSQKGIPSAAKKAQDESNISERKAKVLSTMRSGQRVTFKSSPSRSNQPEQKKPEKKRSVVINLLLLIIIGAVISFVVIAGKNKTFKIKSKGPLISKSGTDHKKAKKNRSSQTRDLTDAAQEEGEDQKDTGEETKKKPMTSSQKPSSDSYTDSATMAGNDYTRAIKFYKIAISFNQYNLRAWQGLLSTYRSARMYKEAEETENRMAELFKEETFSIGEIIKPYGVLSGYNRDEHGVCRIEYRSNSEKRPFLEKETFHVIRALIAHESCQSVSLYASTGKGKGMLVRVSTQSFPSSFSGYTKHAQISFIE